MYRPMVQVEGANVKIFLSTFFTVALRFCHKQGIIRNFLKTLGHFFDICYGFHAVGASASHEIPHISRRSAALLCTCISA